MWETQEITFKVPGYKINEIDKWAVVAGLNKDGKSVDEVREEFINDAIALLINCLDMSVDGYRICGIQTHPPNEKTWVESPYPDRRSKAYAISSSSRLFGDIVWTDMQILANARQRRAND